MKSETPTSNLSKTDQATVASANELLSNLYKAVPSHSVRNATVTQENIDQGQALAEQIEVLRIRKNTKQYKEQGGQPLHWQRSRAFGRLKAARAAIDYPHERQVAAAAREAEQAASSSSSFPSSCPSCYADDDCDRDRCPHPDLQAPACNFSDEVAAQVVSTIQSLSRGDDGAQLPIVRAMVASATGLSQTDITELLVNLMNCGVLYEPKPGHVRVIEEAA